MELFEAVLFVSTCLSLSLSEYIHLSVSASAVWYHPLPLLIFLSPSLPCNLRGNMVKKNPPVLWPTVEPLLALTDRCNASLSFHWWKRVSLPPFFWKCVVSFTANGKRSSPVLLTCVICVHCVCLSTLVPLMYVMIVYLYGAHLWDKGSYSRDKGCTERGFVLARRGERCHRQL